MPSALKGSFSILASAILFYLATFFVKKGAPEGTLESLVYVAFRFWIGYGMILAWLNFFKKTPSKIMKIVNRKWLWMRAFWNLVAVLFFYLGVVYGTVTGANIINMTYPVFVALFSIFFIDEKPDLKTWAGVLLSIMGTFLVTSHSGEYRASFGDIFALCSAITAGVAIVALRKIRLTDTTESALFYNFRLGFWTMLPALIYYFLTGKYVINGSKMIFPLLSGISGFLGQVALTYGFKFVSAVQGSILSASRLIFAVILGWIFFQGEISVYSIGGAIVILSANVILAIKKNE